MLKGIPNLCLLTLFCAFLLCGCSGPPAGSVKQGGALPTTVLDAGRKPIDSVRSAEVSAEQNLVEEEARAKKDYVHGDFINSPLQMPDYEFEPAPAIRAQLERHQSKLNLFRILITRTKVESSDLEPLASSEAREYLRDLNLACAKASEEVLEVIKDLRLTHLNMHQTRVRNIAFLKKMDSLIVLNLSETDLSSIGMKNLSGLRNLQELDLSSTPVKDSDLAALTKLSRLQQLRLHNCMNITNAGVKRLQASLPRCRIIVR